ncbi:MAG: EAL domain-containing protein [Pseudomonadota bacterium]|nr:EAL domain-containing protein [Pseudomonadota bacterium]
MKIDPQDAFGPPTAPAQPVPPARRRKSFERILNFVPHLLWSATPDGVPDFLSDQWVLFLGCLPTDLTGEGWLDFVHPEDAPGVVVIWAHSLATGDPYLAECRFRRADGEYRWIMVKALAERNALGVIQRWYGCCIDITDRVVAEQALKRSEAAYRSVLEASADSIKILSTAGKVQLVNTSALKATEVSAAESFLHRPAADMWPSEMAGIVADAVARAAAGETVRFTGFRPTAKGKPKWWDVVVTPISDASGEVNRLLSIARDITVERERSEQLLWASEHDALTGLPNRRAFQNRLQAAALRAMQSGCKLGLLILDLDHFKHVNDTLGHPAGDALLKTIAKRLRSTIREGDFVARVGGDEFAIIVEDIPGPGALMRIGETMVRRLGAPVRVHERALSGGVSIGGAIFPDDANNANDLFKLADTALYSLKSGGRGGTKLFEAHMLRDAERAACQITLARVAVREASLFPHYQAKIRLADDAICGMEALLRWNHPRLGLQLPDTIEEGFKDYEVASKIGDIMQRKVLQDIARWRARGLPFGRVSINAAPVEFLRDDYAERLLRLMERIEIPAKLIEIEVTEHALLDSSAGYVARALKELSSAGVTIALDDFGTGSSSLSHLRDFPVDVVKIDRSFIQNMTNDTEIAAIVAGVIHLARSLGLETVGEGVETPDQLSMLREFGCHVAQGYLFGRPKDAAALAALLDDKLAA